MHFADWTYLGMHAFWWLLWIAIAAGLVGVLVAASRGRGGDPELETLIRRYRRGDLSNAEFDRELEALKAKARPRR
jgi:hypothetical protein